MLAYVKNATFRWLAALAALSALALGLAWVSNGFAGLTGWGGFLVALLLAAALLWLGMRGPVGRPPCWLIGLVGGAALLRLAVGALWFAALPAVGYDTDMQNAGYVMEDAHRRDQAAWALAQSGEPLLSAFTAPHPSDQYGGLLFFSAAVYRTLGGETHQPLLIVVFTAAASALTVAYTWAFTRLLFGAGPDRWAAWGLALYPEAVFLGSTQMREAFLMPLAALAVWGLAQWVTAPGGRRRGGGALAAAFVLMLPLSPTMAAILALVLAVLWLALRLPVVWGWLRARWRGLPRWAWAAFGLAAGLALLWAAWAWLLPLALGRSLANPLDLFTTWARYVAQYQSHLTYSASGWVQKILRSTPEWFHLPFLVGYGLVRPLLPAALLASGAPIWKGIAIWRALGWTLVLAGLLYAPLRLARFKDQRREALAFLLAAWLVVLIASFWGGGDDWDNPRYRAAFSALQVAAAAWAFWSARRQPDPWLKHLLIAGGLALAWVAFWYLQRYVPIFPWGVMELFTTLGLAAITAGLYLAWAAWRGGGSG